MKLWNLKMQQNPVTENFPYYNYGDDFYIFAKDEQEAREIATYYGREEMWAANIWQSPENSTCTWVKTPRKSGLLTIAMDRE